MDQHTHRLDWLDAAGRGATGSQDRSPHRHRARDAFCKTFGEVDKGQPLLYLNSRGRLALGLNQSNFIEKWPVVPGDSITVSLRVPDSNLGPVLG
ncbi:SAM hydroxide adenosyltransferase [Salinispora arenicola]|uniref:SAM hydroxide adenosyltransferase n=1 Tax=Salinispora arenicola TaxID=168697 RepID=UPI0031381F86